MVVLVYLLYRPIQGILEQRKQKISSDLNDAQKSKTTWEQKQHEAKTALEKASAEAYQMVEALREPKLKNYGKKLSIKPAKKPRIYANAIKLRLNGRKKLLRMNCVKERLLWQYQPLPKLLEVK